MYTTIVFLTLRKLLLLYFLYYYLVHMYVYYMCVLYLGLHNLRVGKRTDITLELRDRSDTPMQRGGEIVSAEIKHREAGSIKQLPLQIEDNKDGTYRISFTPDIADKYTLYVNVKNQPIKVSQVFLLLIF